jgi:hypothetical protein
MDVEKVKVACLTERRIRERALFLTTPRAYDFQLRRI